MSETLEVAKRYFDLDGVKIKSSGLEYVIVYKDKVQHIEIRNKAACSIPTS